MLSSRGRQRRHTLRSISDPVYPQCNAKKSFEKFLAPDIYAVADFQNLMGIPKIHL